MKKNCALLPLALMWLVLPSCQNPPQHTGEGERPPYLELLLPERIEIVEPFTGVANFDEDPKPDGIELFVRAVNALENSGLNLVGNLRIELYEFVPSSGNNQGRRLHQWDVELTTVEQQRTHWNKLTQMYRLQLALDRRSVPLARKYLLEVTYTSPLGDRLSDEYMFEFSDPTQLRMLDVGGDSRGG